MALDCARCSSSRRFALRTSRSARFAWRSACRGWWRSCARPPPTRPSDLLAPFALVMPCSSPSGRPDVTGRPMVESLDRGRDASLVAVYLDKRADLRRFFAARLGSVEAAEDLVQEIYLKLVAADAAHVDVHNPSAYLYRLGANL